jgi:hypothetical protein
MHRLLRWRPWDLMTLWGPTLQLHQMLQSDRMRQLRLMHRLLRWRL